jgi:flagellar motor switch/type III secretory pathway protein FliN
MAAAQPIPPAPTGPPRGAAPPAEPAAGNSPPGLVPASRRDEDEPSSVFTPRVLKLPVQLDIAVPVRGFRVRHLLALAPEHIVESQWSSGTDLPLSAGDVDLAWTEFEVVDSKLAVRITRVA